MNAVTTRTDAMDHLVAEPDPFDPHSSDDDEDDDAPYEESPDPT